MLIGKASEGVGLSWVYCMGKRMTIIMSWDLIECDEELMMSAMSKSNWSGKFSQI